MLGRRPIEVVIVGGGASGVLTAARMLDASVARAVRIRIVERSGQVGAGIAYGTDDPDHRLNVRAGGMSADPSRPDDFSRWSERDGAGGPLDFAPRRSYRRYLVDHLGQAANRADGTVDVDHDAAMRIRREDGRHRIDLASGRSLGADQVVLATGNAVPSLPRALTALAGDPRLVPDPWATGALGCIREGQRVVLVGTGLTAVDVAITLARREGVALVATSRHGLLPAAHLPDRPAVDVEIDLRALDPDDLTGLLALVRASVVRLPRPRLARRRGRPPTARQRPLATSVDQDPATVPGAPRPAVGRPPTPDVDTDGRPGPGVDRAPVG